MAACTPLRILLVEDNPAHQKLATYILEDRGHTVECADNGQEAVSVSAQRRYDLILMDVQMPRMDGLEATAAIRKREDGQMPVPIIAMTAHAMQGDRDRCLAAGMDGYLPKPINAQELIGLVERLAGGAAPGAAVAEATPGPAAISTPATAGVFDPGLALTRCFDNPDMVQEMIQCFLAEVDPLLRQTWAALAKGKLAEVGRLGHRLKGTVFYLGADRAKDAAMLVERFVVSQGDPSEAEEAVDALQRECLVLKAALSAYLQAAEPKKSDSQLA
jgi:CheY-like chemotaxis protein